MTKQELSQLYFLGREIQHDQERLKELKCAIEGKGMRITGIPRNINITDLVSKYAAELADLENQMDSHIQKCLQELSKLKRYIDGVDNSFMRQILTLRYINGYSWKRVALKIGGGNTADSIRKYCYRYLEKEKGT